MRLTSRSTLFARAVPALFFLTAQCGSRTPTFSVEGPPECTRDEDCEGHDDKCFPARCVMATCQDVGPVDCDDKDPCTRDICEPKTGACSHPPATVDLDGDGHKAPLPGKMPGELASCGDDCDDRNAAAFPSGREVCDGADNDCNGVVDDGAELTPTNAMVIVSEGARVAEPLALTFAAGGYWSAYSGERDAHNALLIAPLDRNGNRAAVPSTVSATAADSTGGTLTWIGDRFGATWSDRREARGGTLNWEVYFSVLNPDRTKRIPDVRISQAEGFSLNASVAWTGLEFVVVWQEDGMNSFSIDELYAQRIDRDGALVGGNVKLVSEGPQLQTAPVIAAGRRSLGLAWVKGDVIEDSHRVLFAPFDFELRRAAPPAVVSGSMSGAVYPVMIYNAPNYFIAWTEDPPGPAVFGAVRDETGKEVVAAKAITTGNGHARSPALLPYGDRVLLVWADDRDGNLGYELYTKVLDQKLQPLGPEQRVTNTRGDSVDPFIAFGPGGDVGVLFSDNSAGVPQAFFTRFACR
ncbi:MAG: MopE-related protein [Polyangiaceae bacterium]